MFVTRFAFGAPYFLGRISLLACYVLLVLLLGQSSVFAQFEGQDEAGTDAPLALESVETGVWLVTYGPGEVYWQRFGHNGIWIRDQDLGLDHVFNFGFFDFEQENFFLRFLQGKMLYFSAAQPAQREFAQYIDENRSIRLQKLALEEEQALRLADFLVREVQPENRDYLYDYYLDNCSTRIRDALDFALDGHLQEYFRQLPAKQDFRDHTRRLTAADFWLYLGLEMGLGRPVDLPINHWQEFFIPAELATAIEQYPFTASGGDGNLVVEDVMLFDSSLVPPPKVAPMRWHIYLLASMAVLLAAGWLGKKFPSLAYTRLSKTWLLINGLIGSVLVFFWFGTDHQVAASNLNLLVFNPLYLAVLNRRLYKPLSILLIVLGLLALLQSFLPTPPGQYTADVVAAFLPINLLAACALLKKPK